MTSPKCDLLVIGGGMAGLSAAARAAADGARVVLIEKAPKLGGSALLSGGCIWTTPTLEIFRSVVPDGDPTLAEALMDDFAGGMDWVRSLGVECRPPVQVLGIGQGHHVDINAYLRACERLVRSAGGSVRTQVLTEELLFERGEVRGARVRENDAPPETVRAPWTLLATGSFPADPRLLAEHVHPNAASLPVRAHRFNTGDGIRLGLAVGAICGKIGAGFYGHLLPHPVRLEDPTLFSPLTQRYSNRSVLVDRSGERFTDETLGDHMNAQAVLLQPGARALLIADETVMAGPSVSTSATSGGEAQTAAAAFRMGQRYGGRCATAATIDDLKHVPAEWGYDGEAVAETMNEFNRLAADAIEKLRPGRAGDVRPLDRPPFYVMEVQPGVTFSHVGLMIDSSARVLAPDGRPIPGLLAAGADAGGMYVRNYCGGLSAALVFGLRAARTATATHPPKERSSMTSELHAGR